MVTTLVSQTLYACSPGAALRWDIAGTYGVSFKLHLPSCRDQVNRMAEGQTLNQETLLVDIQHLKWFDHELAEQVEIEWLRFEPQMRQAVQRLVREQDPEFVKGDDQKEREFYISWEGIHCVDRLRDLRSAKVCTTSQIAGTR